MISWPAAKGIRWVKPSRAIVSPSRTSSATAAARVAGRATSAPRVPRRDGGVDVDPDRLGLGVAPHRIEAHLAAVARLPDAAERRAGPDALGAVDPHHPAAERGRRAVGAGQVAGPE